MSAHYANEQQREQPQQVEEEYVEEVEQYGVAEDDGAQVGKKSKIFWIFF